MDDKVPPSQLAISASGLLDSLATWLQSWPWSWFFTVTFRKEARYPRQAVSRCKGLHWLWTPCDGCPRGYYLNGKPGDSCVLVGREYRAFVAAEPHSKGDYHVHGLLHHKCASPEDADALEQRLRGRFGFSTVASPRTIGGVAGYCSKYVTKETTDWDLYGPW